MLCALLFMSREGVGGWCDMIMIGDGGLVLFWRHCIGVLGRIADFGVWKGRWEMGGLWEVRCLGFGLDVVSSDAGCLVSGLFVGLHLLYNSFVFTGLLGSILQMSSLTIAVNTYFTFTN